MENKNKFLLYGIFILSTLIIIGLIITAAVTPAAPTHVMFGLNTSDYYDGDGIVSINWTAGDTDAGNYTIWISVDGGLNFFKSIKNDSVTGVIYTNSTDANYTFMVQRVNATVPHSNALNASNISIIMDIYSPSTITLNSYTNSSATNKAYKNTDQLTLNVSVADVNSTSAIYECWFSINGTNQSVSANNGWCNSTTLNLTGATDGIHQIIIYANDSAGNSLLNKTGRYVEIDTTAPAIQASCTSSVVVGESFPCSCTRSDATSGINTSKNAQSSTSDDGTSSPALTGTFTYTCTGYDYAGNVASNTDTYTVTGESNVKKSSSSGPTTKTNLLPKITPGEEIVIKNVDGNAGIKQIAVEVNSEAQNVKVTVSKYDTKPAEVSEKTGDNYRYLKIDTQNLEDKLDKATITIQVEKTWVSNNGLDKDNIALFKFDESNEEWNELTTTYTDEDDTYYYYDVELTSFSYFAISSKAMEEGEEGQPSETGEPGEGAEKTNLTWLWIIIGVVVLAAIIGGGIAMKKKPQQ